MSTRRVAMGSGLAFLVSGAAIIGCASSDRSGAAVVWADEERPTPNLVMGERADENRLAQEFAGRSAWPSFDVGYAVEDVSFFSTFSYDDQSFYDRYSGGYSRQSVSHRAGVIVR